MLAARSEFPALLRLALPLAFAQLGMMLTHVVDTLLVARISTDALAACALAHIWQWSFLAGGMGLVMGIDPEVSQAHGRNDGPAMGLALQRGVVIALLVSVPLCISQAFTEQGLLLLGQPPHIAALAHRFNLWKLPTTPCFLLYLALKQYLQGRGIVGPASYVLWGANVFNALVAWALIFGKLGLPQLGLNGAAIATTLSHVIMVGVLAWLTFALHLHEGAWHPWNAACLRLEGLRATLRVGGPVGAQMLFESLAFTCAGFMSGWLGVAAVGSHQIVLNMAGLAYMLPVGVSMAAATRVGNLIGQGDAEAMRRAARASLWLGALVMSMSALAFTTLRVQLPKLYTDDVALITIAAQILPLAGAFQLADGVQVVAGGVLRGMGRPRAAALANLVGYYVFALPLAYVLGFVWGLGLWGVWLALALGVMGIACVLAFVTLRTARRPLHELQVQLGAASGTAPITADAA